MWIHRTITYNAKGDASLNQVIKLKCMFMLLKEWPAEEGCRERIKSLYTCTLLEYNYVRLSPTIYNL